MTSDIITISDSDLSRAWGKAFVEVMAPGSDLRAMCVSITDFGNESPTEIMAIREELDSVLSKDRGMYSPKITSEMIFPYSSWSRNKPERGDLFKWYLEKYLPRYRANTRRANKSTYFERLIAFRGHSVEANGELLPKSVNQLEHILAVWESEHKNGSRPRQSALQATCFDPSRDHSKSKYLPFPCLQQVGFSVGKESNTLSVTGYYTTQYILDRAYGNYLGLLHLGQFMAYEMNLVLTRVNCFTANPRLSGCKNINKTVLRPLESLIKTNLHNV